MSESSRKPGRVWLVLLVLLGAAGLLFFLLSDHRDKVGVRTATVEPQTLINTVVTNGRVEPLVDFQAHAPIGSVIDSLPVHVGEEVNKGQELVRLDTSDASSKIAAAQATLTGAEGNLHNMEAGGTRDELLSERSDLATAQHDEQTAQASVSTLQALQEKGAASANEVAAAQSKLHDAHARVQQLQTRLHSRYSNIDLATQRAQVTEARSSLAAARSGFSGFDIRSPIHGVVYSLPYARLDFVPAGDALVNVADLSQLQVRAYFDEPVVGKLKIGQPVSISWDARPNQQWHGHVTQAPTTIVTYNGTRNVGVCLIRVDDAHGELIPNINVTVRVTTSEHSNALSIPREALHSENRQNFVYKVVGDQLVRTPVVVREDDVNLTRAGISGGLVRGDVVALSATTDVALANGLRIKVEH